MLLGVLSLGGAVAEMRGAGVADEGDRLTGGRQRSDAPLALPRKDEGGAGLAVHLQVGQELLAPDAGREVDVSLMTMSGRLQPAVAHGSHALSNGSRLQDVGRRHEEE